MRARAAGTARCCVSRAGLGRAEHAVVDHLLDRVPLLRQPAREREPVSAASDEEDARVAVSHVPPSSRTASSSSVDATDRELLRPMPAKPLRAGRRRPGSRRMRVSAPATASTSPTGTRSPLTPSCTISGTPPTAVETTGTPTASASTAECGKFSQALVSSAASRAGDDRERLAREGATRGTRSGREAPESRASPSSHVAVRAVADHDRACAAGTRAIAAIATSSAFCSREPADEHERSGLERHGGDVEVRRRVRQHGDARAIEAPRLPRSRQGTHSGRRSRRRGEAPANEPASEPRPAPVPAPGTPRACRRRARSGGRARRPGRRPASTASGVRDTEDAKLAAAYVAVA